MKLQTVNRTRRMLHSCDWTGVSFRKPNEIVADLMNLIAMAHPDLIFRRIAVQNFILLRHRTGCSTVFPCWSAFDFATQAVTDQLHSVADPQHRNAKIKNCRIALWRVFFIDAVGATREDKPVWLMRLHLFGGNSMANDLAIDIFFANAPRN